ncbi:PQQ-binding-like beta-propeller repeat protein [Candidatus Poribacteria bacterium]
MKKHLMFSIVILLLMASISQADWPQYLGPDRNAISGETGLRRSWPEDGPEVLWTIPLGEGFGGPAVSGGKVYVLDRISSKQDVLRCVDLETGEEEWSFAYDAPGELSHPGSRTVPVIDGDLIYTCGGFGDVYCIDKNTHQPIWSKNVWKDFGGGDRLPNWGVSQNPLIYGNLLILAAQTPEAGVVAYNKLTGDVQWVSEAFPGSAGYVSPTVVSIDEEDQIVMVSSSKPKRGGDGGERRPTDRRPDDERRPPGPPREGNADRMPRRRDRDERPPRGDRPQESNSRVVSIDPGNGKTLWSYQGWQCRTPVPNVTAIGDGRLFITGGYNSGAAMIKVEKESSKYTVTEVYTTQEFGTHVHPAILYNGHLYAHCTDNTGRKDGMVCMDLDGNVKWKTGRTPAFDKGGFILADGMIFSVDGIKGILYLIEPDPEGFRELSSAKLLDTNQCWAPLALSHGKLLIRDKKQMKCVNVR